VVNNTYNRTCRSYHVNDELFTLTFPIRVLDVSEGNGIGTACVPYLLEIGPANLFVRVRVILPNEIPNSVKKL